jgi:single-strand DNA-binding protein
MYQNLILINGRLGAAPELRYTQSGTAVCNIRVAVTRRWKKGDEKQEKTTWFKVVIWSGMGENAGKYLEKGQWVSVRGSIETGKFTGEDGIERHTWEIHADDVQYGPKSGQGSGGNGAPAEAGPPADGLDDDIPF